MRRMGRRGMRIALMVIVSAFALALFGCGGQQASSASSGSSAASDVSSASSTAASSDAASGAAAGADVIVEGYYGTGTVLLPGDWVRITDSENGKEYPRCTSKSGKSDAQMAGESSKNYVDFAKDLVRDMGATDDPGLVWEDVKVADYDAVHISYYGVHLYVIGLAENQSVFFMFGLFEDDTIDPAEVMKTYSINGPACDDATKTQWAGDENKGYIIIPATWSLAKIDDSGSPIYLDVATADFDTFRYDQVQLNLIGKSVAEALPDAEQSFRNASNFGDPTTGELVANGVNISYVSGTTTDGKTTTTYALLEGSNGSTVIITLISSPDRTDELMGYLSTYTPPRS